MVIGTTAYRRLIHLGQVIPLTKETNIPASSLHDEVAADTVKLDPGCAAGRSARGGCGQMIPRHYPKYAGQRYAAV